MKIAKITVYVNDQQQAIEFWVNKAGFVLKGKQPIGEDAFWIEVAPNEHEFTSLVLYSKPLMEKQKPSNVAHPSIMFSTTDIESAYENMKNNGVEVDELMRMPYGAMFTFKDQDGNAYVLRED